MYWLVLTILTKGQYYFNIQFLIIFSGYTGVVQVYHTILDRPVIETIIEQRYQKLVSMLVSHILIGKLVDVLIIILS